MKVLIFLTVIIAVAYSGLIPESDLDSEWNEFKKNYDKTYESEKEEQLRKEIFEKNLKLIQEHNEKFSKGLTTFQLGVNKFADLSLKEMNQFKGFILPELIESSSSQIYTDNNVEDLPDEIDWTKKGVVTPIKDQGNCGGCWAFSAVASMESQHALKTGNLVELSEQELLDCSRSEGTHGCEGGYMNLGFKFVIDNHGIDTEKSYPYKAVDESCRKNEPNKTIGATIQSFANVKQFDELALQSATAKIGPISVAIDASSWWFFLYKSGVYDHTDCSSTALDHGVTVVGYGTLNGKKYWKVKNSWGTDWGMNGYILMSRDKHNQCGIATNASYPIV